MVASVCPSAVVSQGKLTALSCATTYHPTWASFWSFLPVLGGWTWLILTERKHRAAGTFGNG